MPHTCIFCNMTWYKRSNLKDHLCEFHRIVVPGSVEVAQKFIDFSKKEQGSIDTIDTSMIDTEEENQGNQIAASKEPKEDEKKIILISLMQPKIHWEVNVCNEKEESQNRNELKLSRKYHYGCYKFQCNMCSFTHRLKFALYIHRKRAGHMGPNIIKTMQVKLNDYEKNEKFIEGSLVNVLMAGFPWWPAVILKGWVDFCQRQN